MLRNRINWTRAWLGNFTHQPVIVEDYEFVDHDETTSSDLGVETLPDTETIVHLPTLHDLPTVHDLTIPHDLPTEHVDVCKSHPEPSYDSHPGLYTDALWTRDLDLNLASIYDLYPTKAINYGPVQRPTQVPSDLNLDSDFDLHPTEAINYGLAGRPTEVPFRDLRSAGHARRRQRDDREKYYGYRAVSRAQLHVPHYDVGPKRDKWGYLTVDVLTPKAVVMSQRMLYEQAQEWPRPPKYSRSRRDHWPFAKMGEKRIKMNKHLPQDLHERTLEAYYINNWPSWDM